jgi:hypothetical protein
MAFALRRHAPIDRRGLRPIAHEMSLFSVLPSAAF